jgi:hypothetical protein
MMGVLEAALDAAPTPVEVFFRDDDAGWEDARLLELVARFAEHGLPVDLAVIPAALGETLAARLRDSHAGLHQHGYAHTNHQPEGRKCEFGPARPRAAQREDIERGRERLRALLGPRLDPCFTPPWNRCTRDTAELLTELGFTLLSREHRAEPYGLLPERPVHLDVARLAPEELETRFAAHVRAGGPIGVMFHHGVMDRDAMTRASALLRRLARHANVHPRRMADLCP